MINSHPDPLNCLGLPSPLPLTRTTITPPPIPQWSSQLRRRQRLHNNASLTSANGSYDVCSSVCTSQPNPPMAGFWLLGDCNGSVVCFDDNDAHGFWETHQQSVLFFFLDVRCIHVSWGWKVTSVQMIPWNQKWMPHPFWSSVALVVCQKLPKSSTSMLPYSPLYLVCEQPYKLVVPL